jgi:putative copper export protein
MVWDLLLVPARVLYLGASASLAGALVFHAAVAPLALRRWLGPCLLLTLAATLLRLLVLSGAFTEADDLAAALLALPEVTLSSRIGQALLAQAGLLVAATALARWLPPVAALLALGAQVAPLSASHAAALQDGTLQLALALHVLAGSVWLGGLLPLWRAVGAADAAQAQRILLRFSSLALAMVVVLAGSALWQAMVMTGGLPGLLGTTHGQLMLAKSTLMLALLALAALNHVVFLPTLRLGALRRSILAEAALGLLVLALAGWLASVPPALHEQPLWPLPSRLLGWDWSLGWDWVPPPGWAVALLTGLALAPLLARRRRRVTLALVAVFAFGAVGWGGLKLDWTPATPTSFQTAPQPFDTASILRGEALVAAQASLRPLLGLPPAPTTEGDWFWQAELTAPALDQAQRWDVAQFLYARQAGLELREEGAWSHPTLAPDFELLCRNGGPTRLSALRGQILRLAIGFVPVVSGTLSVSLDPGGANADCTALDPAARHAYALLTGLAEEPRLDGLWLLVDSNGGLRGSGFRTMPDILEEAALAIGVAPVAAARPHH